ncbi:MAG: GNAT family N-acetyltransferase [Flavobacteriales bacterium]|nr:GNAT family N-acetyltransferase [Flavobacteriales bacterium]
MAEEYSVLRVEPSRYVDVQTLIRRCFGRSVPMERLVAKFDTSRFGRRDIGYLAYDRKDRPAAYYGVFPLRTQMGGRSVLAAQSGDTMTDPEHQRKGLFVRLATKTYELAADEGVAFVFGFPNMNSYPGFERKLGWQFDGRLQEFRWAGHKIPICELASKSVIVEQFYSAVLKDRGKDGSAIEAQTLFSDAGAFSVERGRNFLEYKLACGAMILNSKVGPVLVHPKVHAYIGDIPSALCTGVSDLRRYMENAGKALLARQVVFSCSRYHPAYSMLSKGHRGEDSLPIGFLDLMGGQSFEGFSVCRADLDTF